MPPWTSPLVAAALLALTATGCRTAGKPFVSTASPTPASSAVADTSTRSAGGGTTESEARTEASPGGALVQASYQPAPLPNAGQQPTRLPPPPGQTSDGPTDGPSELTPPPANGASPAEPETVSPPEVVDPEVVAPELSSPPLGLEVDATPLLAVVQSVRLHFPMIREAAAGRIIASGEALSASGAFDRKFDSFTNVQPLDFYENHWATSKLKRNTMWGGTIGGGYKIGRGSFEPWFRERETNDLGELSLELTAPIGRDFRIDANRAELWRARLEQGRIEPVVRAAIIMAVRDGVRAYWEWVAAAANLAIAEDVLQLGVERVDFLEKQITEGEKARIDRVDNRRIIVKRQAKVVDARRKLEQTAVKLSLFYRSDAGQPVLLGPGAAPKGFPEVAALDPAAMVDDTAFATATRPELAELSVIRRQLAVALQQARNETRVDVDAGLFLGQDIGNPTSSDDKSEFEIEATLLVSVPLERRKALGKVRQIRGKFAKVRAKTQFTADKITAEVRIARAALLAAEQRIEQTSEGVRLAEEMRRLEQINYREGDGTLFNLNLREEQAADARVELVLAQLDYFLAFAEYTAALGLDGATLESVYRGDAAPAP